MRVWYGLGTTLALPGRHLGHDYHTEMAEIINLNKRRKQAARKAEADQAAVNRQRFGRTKVQKARDQKSAEDAARKLDGLRRETPNSDLTSTED